MKIIGHMDCDANFNRNLNLKKTNSNPTYMLVKLFRENKKAQN
jgi:hypothetical protein